ncbi:BQ5605_C006g04277 [Microbotryum silenes-dioicae]|uniref:BQ5605_C006g04277 protein n=1 Tax=Microbotryum silenes-dioicae TaxID=796604 RepID=A0A2X0P294_9BASI|nr:BQ5605_C006g04277 [Microbotryum silenes-dioicae]
MFSLASPYHSVPPTLLLLPSSVILDRASLHHVVQFKLTHPSSSSRSNQQNQPPARHDNNSSDLGIATRIRPRRAAVHNGQRGQRDGRPDAELAPRPPPAQRRVRKARIALKPLKPHVSIRDDLGPQAAVCTHCKAWHLECERICSQGKVQLPPPPQPNLEYRQLLEGSDSEAKAFRENAQSYNNALSFTSLAAHWDQTQVGTLGPPVFRVFSHLYHRIGALFPAVTQRPTFAQTWLIDPAEATDTRLGPDGADSRMQRSTLTKLESILRTGNRFVREFASAKARAGWYTAKEWILRLLSSLLLPLFLQRMRRPRVQKLGRLEVLDMRGDESGFGFGS